MKTKGNKTNMKKHNRTRRKGNLFPKNIFSIFTNKPSDSSKKNPEGEKEKESLYYSGFEKEYNKKNISYKNLSSKLIKIFKTIDTPKGNLTPQNDFYNYVNKVLIEKTKVEENQKYIVQVDDFRLVQDKVYHELLKIVENYTRKNNTRQSVQMKNLYESVKNGASMKLFKEHVIEAVTKIDYARQDKNNLWLLLGKLNQNDQISYACPFSWSLNPDDKQSNIFRCYVDSPKLTLIDLNVYFDDGTDIAYKENYRKKYFEYLYKLFDLAFGPNHNMNIKDVYDVEVDIINAIGCDEGIPISPDNYNKVTTKEAMSKYNFNWEEFSQSIGFSSPPPFFITSNLNYLKCGTKLLMDNWNSEKWRTYWIYIIIRHFVRVTHEYAHIYYDFFGNFMTGTSARLDTSILPIFSLSYAFNTFLTNEYIDHYQRTETVNYLKNMADDLKEVFIKIVTLNKWLQPKTKRYALLKLKHLDLIVGSPKELTADPDITFENNNPMDNMRKIGEWRHERFIELEGKEVVDFPTVDWSVVPPKLVGTQAYIVNASYTPSKNAIYVPLGYIQKPFIDLDERGIEYNLAHIGFTLAHEMSHSLDDWGSQYDYKGNLNNWWTAEDKRKFKIIQNGVIKQYELFAKRDGIDFDASIGIGEDLADISGLNICNEYLAEFQEKNRDVYPIRKLSFEVFYIYFAYQMRQKISKKAISAQLKTNPHPLDKYRTNIPLSRLKIFQEIYNIHKGDKMYWDSESIIW